MTKNLILWIISLAIMFSSAKMVFTAEEYVKIGIDNEWNQPRPDKADLSVVYIKRLPRYPGNQSTYKHIDEGEGGYLGDLLPPIITNKDAKKNPQAGDEVTFYAYVKNKGPVTVQSYDWHWLIDGRDVKSGIAGAIKLNEQHVYELKWKWQDGAHFVSFEVDRRRLLDEITRNNNFVADQTNALAFHFFVEESVYKWFDTVKNGLGSYCWEDWAQLQVREMNRMFRDSIYPSTPNGIEERVRLDEVTIIPDGWGDKGGTHTPFVKTPVNYDNPEFVNANEKKPGTVGFGNGTGGTDGVWGFTVDLLKPDADGLHFYTKVTRWLTGPEWPLHHELGHQLGRADHYLVPISPEKNKAVPGMGYPCPQFFRDSMMFSGNYAHDENIGRNRKKWDSTYRFYDEYTSRGFNRDKGVRRGMFGEYSIDVPTKNTFTFVDEQGTPLAEANVSLHRVIGHGYTNGTVSDKPAYTGKTDKDGSWMLTKPVYDIQLCWMSNAAIFFLVEKDGRKYGGFTDVSELNLEYWRGNKDNAKITIIVKPVP